MLEVYYFFYNANEHFIFLKLFCIFFILGLTVLSQVHDGRLAAFIFKECLGLSWLIFLLFFWYRNHELGSDMKGKTNAITVNRNTKAFKNLYYFKYEGKNIITSHLRISIQFSPRDTKITFKGWFSDDPIQVTPWVEEEPQDLIQGLKTKHLQTKSNSTSKTKEATRVL